MRRNGIINTKGGQLVAFAVIDGWRRSEILHANPSVKTVRLIVSAHKSRQAAKLSGFPFFKRLHAWRIRPVAFCVISNCANFPKSLRDVGESCELPSFAIPVACRNASGVPLTARACTPRFVDRENLKLVDSATTIITGIPEQIVKDRIFRFSWNSLLRKRPAVCTGFIKPCAPYGQASFSRAG